MAVSYYSHLYAPTLKEVPAEAQIPSHQLLLRAGYVRKLASGLYSYLPLAVKVLFRIEKIVREELNQRGCQEVLLPILGPSELWEESGRFSQYGPELMKLQDRHERTFVLGPTHEEIMCDLVKGEVNSYKQLPLNLYQISDKFRDELRPRFGLMRGREFIMKDGYSFDADEKGMEESYQQMFLAYRALFAKMGLKTLPVAADSGQIGGSTSVEFMALAEEGEAEVLYCDCGFAADVEAATAAVKADYTPQHKDAYVKVSTPSATSISQVAEALSVLEKHVVKAVALHTEKEGFVVLFVPGDHDVNEIKLSSRFGEWHFMTKEELSKAGLIEGFIGPVSLSKEVTAYKDVSLKEHPYWICGANEVDAHLLDAKEGRDFEPLTTVDVVEAQAGDLCPECNKALQAARGIEVGQVFQLGDKYSKPMEATYLDEEQKSHYFQMGCYGIGISRTLQALVAEFHDEAGIIWPLPVAPFAVHIVLLDPKDAEILVYTKELSHRLSEEGYDVLIDDRPSRPGPKFKDAELLGMPVIVSIGARSFKEGVLEVQLRKDLVKEKVELSQAASTLLEKLQSLGFSK